jgi:hypothetical protein
LIVLGRGFALAQARVNSIPELGHRLSLYPYNPNSLVKNGSNRIMKGVDQVRNKKGNKMKMVIVHAMTVLVVAVMGSSALAVCTVGLSYSKPESIDAKAWYQAMMVQPTFQPGYHVGGDANYDVPDTYTKTSEGAAVVCTLQKLNPDRYQCAIGTFDSGRTGQDANILGESLTGLNVGFPWGAYMLEQTKLSDPNQVIANLIKKVNGSGSRTYVSKGVIQTLEYPPGKPPMTYNFREKIECRTEADGQSTCTCTYNF